MPRLLVFVLGILIGAVSSVIGVYHLYESNASNFITSRLSEQERISAYAFGQYSDKASIFSQMNYLIFLREAQKASLISDPEYNEAAAAANARLCINYEEVGETGKAQQFCKWAEDHLSKWPNAPKFDDFKREHRERYSERERAL